MYWKKPGIPCGIMSLLSASCACFVFFLFFLVSIFPLSPVLHAQTELGSEDDLTVLGVNGTADDPDAEIKGFTVFGSTQAAYTGAVAGAGNVVVNGRLAVSSGAYFVGGSTFAAGCAYFAGVSSFSNVTDIHVAGGTANQVLKKVAGGGMAWDDVSAMVAGDNLGSHIATTTLNMSSWDLVAVSSVNFKSGVFISSAAAAQGGGVYVSTNLFIVGFSSAAGYYGNGAALANVTTSYVLGQSFGGGKIFWIDPSGKQVLISATGDQSGAIAWSKNDNRTGANLDGIYAGKANTVTISTMQGSGSYAAQLCSDYGVTVNNEYYDDWYLPSKYEAHLLYAQKNVVGGFAGVLYHTANEYTPNPARCWAVFFGNDSETDNNKGSSSALRCIRAGPSTSVGNLPNLLIGTQAFTGANTFQMGVTASSFTATGAITAARYQIAGSTVLAILPGTNSLGVGLDVGRVNTGNFNSFLGYGAGYSNTTGSGNSFLGFNVGYNNTTSSGNSFLGSVAGRYNTGSNNSFFGNGAGYANTTGSNNSFLGYRVGYNTKAGSANAVFGHEAGYGVVDNSFSSSTLVGYQAGYGLSTGSDNIFLGWQAGYAVTTGTGNIIIGYNKGTSAPAANNELNIGGVLYGDLSAKTIGISTRAPQAALDIVSTGTLVSQYAQIWRASDGTIVSSMTATGVLYPQSAPAGDNLGNHTATQALNISNNAIDNVSSMTVTGTGVTGTGALFKVAGSTMVVLNNGNVGIGTINPSVKLDIQGANGNIKVGNNQGLAGTGGTIWLRPNNATNGVGQIIADTTGVQSFYNSAGSIQVIFNNGAVGIGTAAPLSKLDVFDGSITVRGTNAGLVLENASRVISPETSAALGAGVRISTNVYIVGFSSAVKYYGDGSGLTNLVGAADNLGNHTATTNLSMAGFDIINASSITVAAAKPGLTISTNLYVMNGNVGIGTANPIYALDVNGTIRVPADLGNAGIRFGSNLLVSGQSGQGVLYLQPIGNGNQSAIHLLPTSGTWPTDTLNELVLNRTSGPFGGDYERLSLTNIGSDSGNIFALHQETGPSSTVRPVLFSLGHEASVGVFTSYEYFRLMDGTNLGNTAFGLSAPHSREALQLQVLDIGSPGTRDSHSILWRGKANDGSEHAVDWRQYVDVTSNAGASTFIIQNRVDGAAFADKLAVMSAGYVGIGTAGPATKLEVSAGDLRLSSGYTLQWGGTNNRISGDETTDYLQFVTNGSEAMRIISSGNAGIGTAGPLSKFDVFDGSITVRGTNAGLVLENASRVISPETSAALGAGVRISTNVYIVGFSSAAKYYGDGSSLTGLTGAGDNLGNHTASADLTMTGYNVTAARYITASSAALSGQLIVYGTSTLAGAARFNGPLVSTGNAQIAKYTVQAADTGITLTSADFGKTITVNSGSAQTVTLPSVTAADIGATITVVKLGAGKVTIQAAASTYIGSSTSGGTIYNTAVSPAYATITLRLVTATRWMLVGGDGAWIST